MLLSYQLSLANRERKKREQKEEQRKKAKVRVGVRNSSKNQTRGLRIPYSIMFPNADNSDGLRTPVLISYC